MDSIHFGIDAGWRACEGWASNPPITGTMEPQMNLYRQTGDRSLDRKYLRLCTVYRLMSKGLIGKSRALELLAQKHTAGELLTLRGTVELWISHPFKHLRIAV